MKTNILQTLAYADALNMPLTAMEVWRGLAKNQRSENSDQESDGSDQNAEISDLSYVFLMLHTLKQNGEIGEKWGYYFLPGREELVAKRLWRTRVADEKWKELVRIAYWLRAVPFLRGVFAAGSLSISNTRDKSDLDIFVVASPGRIFLCRLFLVVCLKLLGKYRGEHHVSNHVCPNHYVTEDALEIPFRSMYTAHLYATYVRVWSKDPLALERFWEANSWIKDYLALPNGFLGATEMPLRTLGDSHFLAATQTVVETVLKTPLGDFLEKIAKNLQLVRIQKDPRTQDPGSGHVVANDQTLAFHPNSPEKGIIEKYRKNLGFSEGVALDEIKN